MLQNTLTIAVRLTTIYNQLWRIQTPPKCYSSVWDTFIGSMDSPQGTQTFHLSFLEAESLEDSAGERTQDLVSGSITEDLPSPGPSGHSPHFLADILPAARHTSEPQTLSDAPQADTLGVADKTHLSIDTGTELKWPGYVLGAEIGRGGMGSVVAAEQSSLQRTVALKYPLGKRTHLALH